MSALNPALPYWRLSFFYFAYFAVLGGFMPYWSLYLQSWQFGPVAIGQLMAIGMLTRIIAPSFWGYLADQTGQRLLLVRLGATMLALFWLGIFFVGQQFALMAVVLFGYSFFQNAILAQFEAVTIAHLGAERARYGQIRLWGSLGFIAAVASLGYVFDVISVRWLPVILLVSALLAALVSFTIPQPLMVNQRQQQQPFWHTLAQRPVIVFFLCHFMLQLSHAPYYSFFSVYLESHHYQHGEIGLLWAWGVLAEVLAFTQTHRLLKRWSESQLITCCLLMAALRWWVIAWYIDQPWLLWTVQSFHAFSFAVFHAVAMQFIFRQFSVGQQGQGQALYSALWGLGVGLGSWLTGMYWQSWGAGWIFSTAAGCCLLVWCVWLLFAPKDHSI